LNQISNETSDLLTNIHKKIHNVKRKTDDIIETLIPYSNKSEINEVRGELKIYTIKCKTLKII
jgi:hypothetical protein